MKKVILVSREGGETRVCLLVSGKLVNIDIEGPDNSSIIGNIYKGRITDMSRGLNAAFVNIGEEKEGFLSVQDVHPAILKSFPRRPHIFDVFEKGQEILVQVVRDAVKDKGPMLTTCLSLPGRYVVLIPDNDRTGISKKLPDEERQRLREIVAEVEIPEGFGVIVRTAGEDRRKQDLLKDLNQLVDIWKKIEEAFGQSKAPALLVQEQNVAVRFLREYLTTDVSEIITDDKELLKEIRHFLTLVMPKFKKGLQLYEDRLPLFSRYGVESQIENMFMLDVPLPSGGRIVIDRTEALIAIDVNSGRTRESNVEELATKANLEAADEIARQLALRDLGGLVVIDFIDMRDMKNRRKVQTQLSQACKMDKAKISMGRITQFGLLEMTRQKLRTGVVARTTEPCPACSGLGYRRTVPADALHIIRKLRELAVSEEQRQLTVSAPVGVANYMQNTLRGLIYRLEKQYDVRISILGKSGEFNATIEGSNVSEQENSAQAPVEAPVFRRRDLPGEKTTDGVRDNEPAAKEGKEEAGSGEKESQPRPNRDNRDNRNREDKPPQRRANSRGQSRSNGRRDESRGNANSPNRGDSERSNRDRRPDKTPNREPEREQRAPAIQPEERPVAARTVRPADTRDGFLDNIIKKLLGLDQQ